MSYNFVADSFHTKKLCSRLLQAKCDFRLRLAVLPFWAPFEGLKGNVQWSSLVYWKTRRGPPISVNWTVFARWYGWSGTSEYLLKIGSLRLAQFDPKFQVEGVAPTNHSSCHKTRVNGLSCGIWMRAQLSFVLSQITRLTDRQTEFSSLDRVCIPCSEVKM